MSEDRFQQLAKIIPNVSRETFADLCAYEALLRQWQPHINLIANSTLAELWQRHILDSAQLFPLSPDAKIWLDLGSGGGFPALTIACLLKQRNAELENTAAAHIFLIESNGKKVSFLRRVIQQLALPATVYQNRIEDKITDLPLPNVITARALSSLENLCAYIYPLMAAAGEGQILALLQKGGLAETEIAAAQQKWQFDLERHSSRLAADSVILAIRNLKKRGEN